MEGNSKTQIDPFSEVNKPHAVDEPQQAIETCEDNKAVESIRGSAKVIMLGHFYPPAAVRLIEKPQVAALFRKLEINIQCLGSTRASASQSTHILVSFCNLLINELETYFPEIYEKKGTISNLSIYPQVLAESKDWAKYYAKNKPASLSAIIDMLNNAIDELLTD